ncbi:PTS sugar transporter subunit IIA [Niameybacter sp.]
MPKEGYKQGILTRESQSTTGIGDGIAIPHAKSASDKLYYGTFFHH